MADVFLVGVFDNAQSFVYFRHLRELGVERADWIQSACDERRLSHRALHNRVGLEEAPCTPMGRECDHRRERCQCRKEILERLLGRFDWIDHLDHRAHWSVGLYISERGQLQ